MLISKLVYTKTVIFTAAILAIVASSSMPAFAQSSRLYFAGYLGLASLPDQPYKEDITPASGDLTFDNSLSFAAALGVRVNKNLRLEAELSHHKSNLDNIELSGGTFDMSGELQTYTLLVSGIYDWDLDWKWPVQPYVSAGLGFAKFDGDFEDTAGVTISESGDEYGFVWQVGSGLKYRVNPDLAVTGGYRYLSSSEIELDSARIDYSNHEFRMGIEYDIPVK